MTSTSTTTSRSRTHGFVEIAGRNADSITIAYNLSDDVDKFLGGGSMKRVLVDHNTVIRTREPNIDRWIFWTFDRDNTSVTVTNNIFVLPKDIQAFPQGPKPVGHKRTGLEDVVRSNNLYFSPSGTADPVGLPLASGEMVADPRFVGHRISSGTPIVRRGVAPAWQGICPDYLAVWQHWPHSRRFDADAAETTDRRQRRAKIVRSENFLIFFFGRGFKVWCAEAWMAKSRKTRYTLSFARGRLRASCGLP